MKDSNGGDIPGTVLGSYRSVNPEAGLGSSEDIEEVKRVAAVLFPKIGVNPTHSLETAVV